ncbi:cobalt-zinc-cadmium efflux system outer membrane protein [Paraburkholderia sp. UCT70]|uniref:TolC family protein n=1 Tax=Paraburkholderia sp. UCT70 TaxID=2991068 RepID=UPI003D25FE12
MRIYVFLFALANMVSGCVTYQPKPLSEIPPLPDAVLSESDKTMLVSKAEQIRHPRIAPITLDFSRPLTGDELAVIAVLINPDLKALRAKEGVAEAQVFDAGLLPDPQLALGLSLPTSRQPGLVNAYNLGLNWDILSLITRRASERIAVAKLSAVRNDVAWNEWMIANHAWLLAERVTYLQIQERLARDAAATAAQLCEISRHNLQRHDIKIDEFALRQVAYLDAQDRTLALTRELEKARQELNQDLGLPPSERLVVAARPISVRPHLDAQALFDTARDQRLDLIALRAGYAAQENQLYKDLLARFPQINLGLNRARDTGDVTTIGFSISMTLPVFNGNRGTIAVARATREQLYVEYLARLYKTRADIAALVADLERIDREMVPLQNQLPELQRAEQRMRGGVDSGDVTLINYETVRASLLDKRLKLSSLEQAASEERIALQLATGAPWRSQESAR